MLYTSKTCHWGNHYHMAQEQTKKHTYRMSSGCQLTQEVILTSSTSPATKHNTLTNVMSTPCYECEPKNDLLKMWQVNWECLYCLNLVVMPSSTGKGSKIKLVGFASTKNMTVQAQTSKYTNGELGTTLPDCKIPGEISTSPPKKKLST